MIGADSASFSGRRAVSVGDMSCLGDNGALSGVLSGVELSSAVRPSGVGWGRDGSRRTRDRVSVGHRVLLIIQSTITTRRATVVTETTGIVTVL